MTLRSRVLAYVAAEPSATSRDLAEDLGVSVVAASSALSHLAARGRLRRIRCGAVYAYRVPE